MLTATQLAALKAAITGTPALAAFLPNTPGALADYANAVPTTGATNVWRPSIPVDELKGVIDWSVYAGLSVALQNTYLAMTVGSAVDATKASIRAGFGTVFGAGATLTALTVLAQRPATRFESLYAVNNVTPVFGQLLDVPTILQAMSS